MQEQNLLNHCYIKTQKLHSLRLVMIELQQGIGQFLQATGSSSGEPLEGYCQLSGKPGIEVKIIDPKDHLPVVSSGKPAIKEEMQ